jgi:heme/copper-type cytochrome/quinol oxidase subunit 2
MFTLDKEKKNSKRLWIILAIVVFVLLAAIAVLVVVLINKSNQSKLSSQNNEVQQNQTSSGYEFQYETSAIATDPVTLQELYNEMLEKAEDGTMALEMKTEAVSSDGTVFDCYIANAINNKYDMFVVIYLDETQEEVYRSGLIPLGSRIESFTTSRVVEPGTHVGTIVYNQVEDDHSTIHAQVNIGLNLIVNE